MRHGVIGLMARTRRWTTQILACSLSVGALADEQPKFWQSYERELDRHWSTSLVETSEVPAQPFLIPLGTMKKHAGVWRPEAFEPVAGTMVRTTWSVSGIGVLELFEQWQQALLKQHTLRWSCSGRACGNAAEWASRVYGERLLYGRDESMRYAAFRTDAGTWVTLFSAARTADRQYLHLDAITPN